MANSSNEKELLKLTKLDRADDESLIKRKLNSKGVAGFVQHFAKKAEVEVEVKPEPVKLSEEDQKDITKVRKWASFYKDEVRTYNKNKEQAASMLVSLIPASKRESVFAGKDYVAENDPEELWKIMSQYYDCLGANNKNEYRLMAYETFEKSDSKDVLSHVTAQLKAMDKLISMGETMSEQNKMEVIINSLPKGMCLTDATSSYWQAVKDELEIELKDDKITTVTEVVARLTTKSECMPPVRRGVDVRTVTETKDGCDDENEDAQPVYGQDGNDEEGEGSTSVKELLNRLKASEDKVKLLEESMDELKNQVIKLSTPRTEKQMKLDRKHEALVKKLNQLEKRISNEDMGDVPIRSLRVVMGSGDFEKFSTDGVVKLGSGDCGDSSRATATASVSA